MFFPQGQSTLPPDRTDPLYTSKLIDILADYVIGQYKTIPPAGRYIVGIAGIPASGKSTLAKRLVERLNGVIRTLVSEASLTSPLDAAVLVGLDGWHLTRTQLDAFPDPKLAHDRRGAHWTFDGAGYVEFVCKLTEPIPHTPGSQESGETLPEGPVIYAPSFSHERKDPVPEDVKILPKHRIIVIEGLYTFLGIEPWLSAGKMLQERWWIEVSEEEAEERLVKRHVLTGVTKGIEEARWRARENDTPNGLFIRENMLQPTRVIHSVKDVTLANLSSPH